MSIRTDYVPGVCNIGSEEVRRRRRLGTAGVVATAALWLALAALGPAPGWFLLVFFPALGAAIGLVQSAARFCIYFGFASLFNFSALGRASTVPLNAARRADRAMSWRLLGYSVLIAAGVALVAFALAARL